MPEKIISIKGLTKKYGSITAVDNLSLNLYRGDIYGFLGPNGAGKSTTIRMLLTLIFPSAGEIEIFGMPLRKKRLPILRRIGAIVEKPDFYNYLSAYKNLEILGRLSGCDTSKKHIMELLELTGLAGRSDSKVKTYSSGMKQRLGIAQALLHDPELIILDEPTTGLDPQGMKDVRDLIVRLSREKGKTILLSSHLLYEVESVANRMIIIDRGKTVIEGTVEELLDATAVSVSLETGNNEQAKEVISIKFPGIKFKEETSGMLTLDMRKEELPGLVRVLTESGIDIYSVTPRRSLEDYFLSLTGENGR